VTRDAAGQEWAVLEGHYQWSQKQAPEDEATREPHHLIWTQIRSYIVEASDIAAWTAWARGQDWNGRWMPESTDPWGLFLADHPYLSAWPDFSERAGSLHGRVSLPGVCMVTTTNYVGTGGDWDQSDSKHLGGVMPSTAFCSFMGLERTGDFRWGRAGHTLAENYSVRSDGPNSVHVSVSELTASLRSAGKCLLWTVLGEKQTTDKDDRLPRDGSPFLRSFSASYLHNGEQVRLIDANSHTMLTGGGESGRSRWNLPEP
jgi:hypothetical protein